MAASGAALEPQDVEGRDGLGEPLEGERAHLLGLDEVLHFRGHPRGDEDLAGLGFAAEARRQVGDGADSPVVPASLETYAADGCVPLGDAEAAGGGICTKQLAAAWAAQLLYIRRKRIMDLSGINVWLSVVIAALLGACTRFVYYGYL